MVLGRSLPEIRIFFAHLLYSSESKVLAKELQQPLKDLAFYRKKTSEFQSSWEGDEQVILEALTKILNVGFYRDTIDVALAPFFRPASHPLILNFKHPNSSHFVDSLTHELIHILLVDNTLYQTATSSVNILDQWRDLFGERPVPELVHIGVHALLKFVYLDVHHDLERLARDIRECEQYPPYSNAWNYVNNRDYHEIIQQLRQIYSSYEDSP